MREVNVEVQLARIESQLTSFIAFASERLDEITDEVKKTNGRVSKLEEQRAVFSALREYQRDQRNHPDQQILTVAWLSLLGKYGVWIVGGAWAIWEIVQR